MAWPRHVLQSLEMFGAVIQKLGHYKGPQLGVKIAGPMAERALSEEQAYLEMSDQLSLVTRTIRYAVRNDLPCTPAALRPRDAGYSRVVAAHASVPSAPRQPSSSCALLRFRATR